ncbi:MAG: putative RNA methylase [Flavobacteriaceae bacterium]|jgi:predicted RNA methylase
MINKNFYPTPKHLIEKMVFGLDFKDKYVCDPSAGKGDILDYVKNSGAKVYSYEIEKDLIKILSTKCNVLGENWLEARAEDISYLNYIIMNPPFDNADKHILHAWEIAPEGCEIIVICNANTIREDYSVTRKRLTRIIKSNGTEIEFLEGEFKNAERTTNVEIAYFKLFKPGKSEDFDYEGFYMDDEPTYTQEGLIPHDEIRDIVGRYIGSLKAFDKMSVEMSILKKYATSVGLSGNYSLQLHGNNNIQTKEEFLKELQKSAWEWVFRKLNIERMVTAQVKEKLNKFVETQHKIPFTVKNVNWMINIIAGTFKENMDKAMVSIFDHLTERYHENRYNVEGWKTNKSYCIGKKFIIPSAVKVGYNGEIEANGYESRYDKMTDLQKSMSFLAGERYKFKSLYEFFSRETITVDYKATQGDFEKECKKLEHWRREYNKEDFEKRVWDLLMKREEKGVPKQVYKQFGEWYDFGFFMIKGFKKGTLHCKFKDQKQWELLNRKVNELKGFPLPEKI